MDDAVGYNPNNYPSKVEATGMPARLHEFAVRFPRCSLNYRV